LNLAKLTEFILAILNGEIGKIGNYAHLKPKWPKPGKHYDATAWLNLEVITRSGDKSVVPWLKTEVARFEKTQQIDNRIVY
jgi:hypothetical protein